MPVIPAFYAHISFGFIDYDFGVITPSHRGKVFLWYKLQFVLQRHTLPVAKSGCFIALLYPSISRDAVLAIASVISRLLSRS